MSSPIFVGDYTPHSDRIYGKYVAVDVPKPIQHFTLPQIISLAMSLDLVL